MAAWTLDVCVIWPIWLPTAYLNNLKFLATFLTFIGSHTFPTLHQAKSSMTIQAPSWPSVHLARLAL